jgi:ribonucleotide reductase class II
MTSNGPRQVRELIGAPFTALVDGKSFASSDRGFFATGRKKVYLLETEEGYCLEATADHPVLRVTSQSRARQTTEWVSVGALRPGDKIRLHNQRDVTWDGDDQPAVGWLLGLLVGDGAFARHERKSDQALLRFWGEHSRTQVEMAHALLTHHVRSRSDLQPFWHPANHYWQLASTGLNDAASRYGIGPSTKTVTAEVERTSSAFYSAFLRGLFDADGTVIGNHEKGISVRLAQSHLELLRGVQRMLHRLGIVSTIYEERRAAGLRASCQMAGAVKRSIGPERSTSL